MLGMANFFSTLRTPGLRREHASFCRRCGSGSIIGISLIEAPLKFTAPGITIPLGWASGVLVFGAMTLGGARHRGDPAVGDAEDRCRPCLIELSSTSGLIGILIIKVIVPPPPAQ